MGLLVPPPGIGVYLLLLFYPIKLLYHQQGGYKIDGVDTKCELPWQNKGVLLNMFEKHHGRFNNSDSYSC